jgi:hypothetical protein
MGRYPREDVVTIAIDHLTEADLIALHHRIVARRRLLEQRRAHGAMLGFGIRERMTFTPEGRPPVTGMVVPYHKKTVTVITAAGQRWHVSPSFLRKAKPTQGTPIRGHVMPMQSPG